VYDLGDQLDETTQRVDHLDGSLRAAQWEKYKFASLAKAVLAQAATDPNAAKIVDEFNLQQVPKGLLDEPAPPTPVSAVGGSSASTPATQPAPAIPTPTLEGMTAVTDSTNAPANPTPPKSP
jgi:hypothetical protein